MSLINLKSIFSPTNTKFEKSDLTTFPRQFDNDFRQTNLQNLDSIYDDGLNVPTGKFKRFGETFKSQFDFNTTFDDGLGLPIFNNTIDSPPTTFQVQLGGGFRGDSVIRDFEALYQDNQPIDKFDTKLNYNQNSSVSQTFTSDPLSSDLTQRGGRDNPSLDSALRGRVYNPIRFSQDFKNENLFVSPEKPPFDDNFISQNSLGLFDPRSTTPKLDTLYFNTNNTFTPATNDKQITFQTAGGVDKGTTIPYSRLADLGSQFISDGLSYEVLYNDNHTPKNNVNYQGQTPINYGDNVNRDNLKIGGRDRVIGGQYGFDRGSEPYVVSPIGEGGRELNKGNRTIPFTRAQTDSDRILSFLTSPQGIAFATQQNINIPIENTVVRIGDKLVRKPQRFGVTYNPLSTLAVQASRLLGESVPNILIRKSGGDLGSDVIDGIGSTLGRQALNTVADLLSPTEYKHSPANSANGSGLPTFSINDTFTGGPIVEGGLLSQIGDALSILNPFDIGTNITPTTTGDKITLANMIKGEKLESSGDKTVGKDEVGTQQFSVSNLTDVANTTVNVESIENGMPFYFKDLRDSSYIFFRAYIEGLTENVSPSYASHNYIGRSEPVYTYERGEREISFTLKLVAQTRGELDKIYEKMNRLTSLCYPRYENDDYGNRMQPPLTKFRYGELFGSNNKELMGYIKSLSYAVDQSSTYETGVNARVPRHISATITYQVIHDKTPNINTKFYGFTGVTNG